MFQTVNDASNFWTDPKTIATCVSAGVALATALVKVSHSAWSTRRQQQLQRRIGPDVYDPEAVHRALRYYVEPYCTSVDPAQEAEPKGLIAVEEPIMKVLDRFVETGSLTRYLVVLADSGMGKSSLLLAYYARNLRQNRKRRVNIAVVHLGLKDADERIAKIENKSDTTLFLDSFDEDTKAIVDHRARISELVALTSGFRRVLLTSRTQFFPTDEEIPRETGLLKVGSRGMEKATHEFRKLYLAPFSDQMVRTYLRRRYPFLRFRRRREAMRLVKSVSLLSVRPMLLTYLPDLLDTRRSLTTSYEVYHELVRKWYSREAAWVDPGALANFSSRLAVNLYVKRSERGSERIAKAELSPLARQWSVPLEEWQISGRSLLNRDASGNYKFAHRSIMEFLLAEILLGNSGIPYKPDSTHPETLLVQFLTNQFIARHAASESMNATGSWLSDPALTDQTRKFLGEGISVVPDRWHLHPNSEHLEAFARTEKARVRKLVAAVPREVSELLQRVLARPIYVDFQLKEFARDLDIASVRDLMSGLQWVVMFTHRRDFARVGHQLQSVFHLRGLLQKHDLRSPTWLDAMILSDDLRSSVAQEIQRGSSKLTVSSLRKRAEPRESSSVAMSLLKILNIRAKPVFICVRDSGGSPLELSKLFEYDLPEGAY